MRQWHSYHPVGETRAMVGVASKNLSSRVKRLHQRTDVDDKLQRAFLTYARGIGGRFVANHHGIKSHGLAETRGVGIMPLC